MASPQRESYALCVFSIEHSYLKPGEHGSSGEVTPVGIATYSHLSLLCFVGVTDGRKGSYSVAGRPRVRALQVDRGGRTFGEDLQGCGPSFGSTEGQKSREGLLLIAHLAPPPPRTASLALHLSFRGHLIAPPFPVTPAPPTLWFGSERSRARVPAPRARPPQPRSHCAAAMLCEGRMWVHVPSLPSTILPPPSFRDSSTHKRPQSLRLHVASRQLQSTWSSQRCRWDVAATRPRAWPPSGA